jgi:hypothetical protein
MSLDREEQHRPLRLAVDLSLSLFLVHSETGSRRAIDSRAQRAKHVLGYEGTTSPASAWLLNSFSKRL